MADLRQQQQQRTTGTAKKKGGGFGTLIVLLLIFVLPRLGDILEWLGDNLPRLFDNEDFRLFYRHMQIWMMRNDIDPDLLPLLIGVAVVFVVGIIVVLSAAGRKRRAVIDSATERVRTNTSAGRTSAATQRSDPRSRSFTPPEPSCIVCDHTGEDHFVHDKAQRIAQLDEWLKNGLIDREEYRVLKDRYERDL